MTRADYGESLFREGCGCAQAVLGAFCEDLGLDMATALKLAAPFGGGMGRLREVCGAVSGMFMAAGLIMAPGEPWRDSNEKSAHYKVIQDLAAKFKEKNGSIICRELLGLSAPEGTHVPEERTAEYYRKRPCPAYVRCAVEILEQYREENGV